MHGYNSELICLVNAETDSMGGVADDGVDTSLKNSPRQVVIEKAEADLREELILRKERRRELEFLRKGGNPLDFKRRSGVSVIVRTTSLNDEQPEQLLNCEAKGSVAFIALPHADSVESTGLLRPTVSEPNGADNRLLDGNNELPEGDLYSLHSGRINDNAKLEQPSKVNSNQNVKDSEDSAIFRPYARRNRSKSNRDGVRSSFGGMLHSRGVHVSYPPHGGSRNVEASASEINDQKDQNITLSSDPKRASSNGCTLPSGNQVNELPDGRRATEEVLGDSKGGLPEDKLNISASHSLRNDREDQLLKGVSKEPSTNPASGEPVGGDQVVSAVFDQVPCEATKKAKKETSYFDEFIDSKGHKKTIPPEGQDGNAAFSMKGLDSESSCTQTSLGLDVNNDNDDCANPQIVVCSRISVEETSDRANEMKKEKNENGLINIKAMQGDGHNPVNQTLTNGVLVKVEEDSHADNPAIQNVVRYPSNSGGQEQHDRSVSKDENIDKLLGHNANEGGEMCNEKLPGSIVSVSEIPESSSSGRKSIDPVEFQASGVSDLKLADKAREDIILEDARKIEVKRKKIAKLSHGILHVECRRKSHWDFVLEEMAWLANDFAQERLWKISAASQLCHHAGVASHSRLESQSHHKKLKKVAYTMAIAVMDFWNTVKVCVNGNHADSQGIHNHDLQNLRGADTQEVPGVDSRASNMVVKGKEQKHGCQGKKFPAPIQKYALRFLKYVSAPVPSFQAEAPRTPEISSEDKPTEGSLFYTVPFGAIEVYRKSIESYLVQHEETGSCMQEEVDTSRYDAGEEFGYQDNVYDEDGGETNSNYLPRKFTTIKSTKFIQKRRKTSLKSYSSRAYELAGDMPYGPCASETQQSMLVGKRPPNSLNVGSIPTKRIRTASRQRIISPYGTGVNGVVESQARTDASSGDTSSFQDDQSTLHGGSHIQRSMEVESAREFEKKLPYDSAETSRPKKKKKTKHPGTPFEQGWQLESTSPSEQRDNCLKRLESHNVDSDGLCGHNTKKPKMSKQLIDDNFDNIAPLPGSIPSPVASQMSNMPNPDKIIKIIGGREKVRKAKVLKMSVVQAGSGSTWSLFEDQALVVLVHDMGPNWELISDAINGTLLFKRIYRKPQECKERHKILMERNSGDGAESAEDSGSAHSYPSTLPGIPKGSARQLFERLQGPMEEDTIKSHFDKIISIGQKLHCRKKDKPNPKHMAPVHNSQVIALSQVCPNNLNGGVLRPIDLCDVDAPNAEVLALGYQGSHGSALSSPNQGAIASMLPNAGLSSSLNGSSGMIMGINQSLPSGSINPSSRDGRYGAPSSSPLTVDEQQRMQQLNQMLPRNVHQSRLSVAGAVSGTAGGVRMAPGGNGMGMMSGVNRNISMPRHAYQGMASSSVLNSGNMLSSGMVGIQKSVNMHPGAGPGQGNPMIRSRESLHTMRPGNNPECQRQAMVPELQMQVTQGMSPGVTPYSGLSSSFPNQTTSPPVQAFPGHSQQQNQISPQQSHALGNHHHPNLQGSNLTTRSQRQAYAIRVAKERQLKQRYLRQQQQQQIAMSNTPMPHAQQQPQLPVSSIQNSSQVPTQLTSHVASLASHTQSSPVTAHPSQHQQKHLLHGLIRNPQTGGSGLSNQIGKQQLQQQQQFSQSGRSHPQQRQPSQQQVKVLKGVGRGNLVVQQSPGTDPAHLNALSVAPGNQSAEKGERISLLMQGQGYASGVNTVQPSKPYIPTPSSNQSQMQQKMHSGGTDSSSKQLQHMSSPSDKIAQAHTTAVPSGHAYTASHQAVPPAIMSSSHLQLPLHPQPHQKPTVQRVLQQNRQVNSDPPSKFPPEYAQSTKHSMKDTLQTVSATSMPRSCAESSKVAPVVSDAVSSLQKALEPVYNSSISNPNPQVSSIGSPPLTNSNGVEPMSPLGQGVCQRLSGSLPAVGHNMGSQLEQQSSMHQFPTLKTFQHHSPEQLILHEQQQSSQQ